MKQRCTWANASATYEKYHDEEWGVPLWDDLKLFEFLILEGAQAGLSWITILNRRDAYRESFHHFSPELMAEMDEDDIEKLMNQSNIIRNRMKIKSAINNAKCYLRLKEEMSLSDFLWQFVGHKPIVNHYKDAHEVPAKTEISEAMSRALKKRGFTFVGPVICYALMQATGMVNDHLLGCFRHQEVMD